MRCASRAILSADQFNSRQAMKTVATCSSLEEAYNLRAFLEGFGIPSFVRDENMGSSYLHAIGGIRVDVEDSDLGRALLVRSSILAASPSVETEGTVDRSVVVEASSQNYISMDTYPRETAIFRAIVRALGVYQLVLGAEDLLTIGLEETGVRHVAVNAASRGGEYVAFASFHFCAALLLCFATDSFARLAFNPRVPSRSDANLQNPATEPTPPARSHDP